MESITKVIDDKRNDLNNVKIKLNNLENNYKEAFDKMKELKNAQELLTEQAWNGLMRFKQNNNIEYKSVTIIDTDKELKSNKDKIIKNDRSVNLVSNLDDFENKNNSKDEFFVHDDQFNKLNFSYDKKADEQNSFTNSNQYGINKKHNKQLFNNINNEIQPNMNINRFKELKSSPSAGLIYGNNPKLVQNKNKTENSIEANIINNDTSNLITTNDNSKQIQTNESSTNDSNNKPNNNQYYPITNPLNIPKSTIDPNIYVKRNTDVNSWLNKLYIKNISPVDFKRTPNGLQSLPQQIKYVNGKIPQIIGTSETKFPQMTAANQVNYNDGSLNFIKDHNGNYIWSYQPQNKIINKEIKNEDYEVYDQLNYLKKKGGEYKNMECLDKNNNQVECSDDVYKKIQEKNIKINNPKLEQVV